MDACHGRASDCYAALHHLPAVPMPAFALCSSLAASMEIVLANFLCNRQYK